MDPLTIQDWAFDTLTVKTSDKHACLEFTNEEDMSCVDLTVDQAEQLRDWLQGFIREQQEGKWTD